MGAVVEQLELDITFLDGTLIPMPVCATSTVLELCHLLEQRLQPGTVVQQVLNDFRPLLPNLATQMLKDCELCQGQSLTGILCELSETELYINKLNGCALTRDRLREYDAARLSRAGCTRTQLRAKRLRDEGCDVKNVFAEMRKAF